MELRELIRAGLGTSKADLVISNGQLVNVVSAEIYPADVAIKAERIVAIGDVSHCIGNNTRNLDADGYAAGTVGR